MTTDHVTGMIAGLHVGEIDADPTFVFSGRKPLGHEPSTVVPVRLDVDLLKALGARADAEHVSRSEAIRAAIRAWLGAA